MELVILAGMPASGKTTFAEKLSTMLGCPMLEKDAIKEELFDVIGFENYTQKRMLDTAATAVLLRCTDALLESGQSLIVVNNFRKDAEAEVEKILNKYHCRTIFIFFGGNGDAFYERYVERDKLHLRHLGHVLQEHYPPHPGDALEYTMTREEFAEKFEKLGMNEFHINGIQRLDVDATYPEQINVEELFHQIQNLLKSKEEGV